MPSYRRVSGGDPISADVLPRKKTRSNTVGCCTICKWVGIVFGLFLIFLIYQGVAAFFDAFIHPYRKAYQSADVSEGKGIKPLFNNLTVFDIEATLWLNVTGYLQHNPDLGEQWQHLKLETYQRGNRNITEAVVFNDIVFKGLQIQSKEHTSVKVRLPSAPFFQDPALGPHLRSTFMLVPRSGVDIPPDAKFDAAYSALPPALLPGRPRPGMDIGAAWDAKVKRTNVADLSSVYGVASAEGQNFFYKRRRQLQWPNKRPFKNESLPVVFLNYTYPSTTSGAAENQNALGQEDSSIWLKNGTTYISKQARFLSTRNRIAINGELPVFENRLFMNQKDFIGRDMHPIMRYAPAMISLDTSAVSKYRLELPDFGTSGATEMEMKGVIEYDWELYYAPTNILFKGRQDLQYRNYEMFQDRFPINLPASAQLKPNMSAAEASIHFAMSGERSHPHHRPWRHFLSDVLFLIFTFVGCLFDVRYWANRSTTTGISIPATLTAVSSTFIFVGHMIFKKDSNSMLAMLTLLPLLTVTACCRLFVALRLERVGWRIRRYPASHRERASSRLDTKPLLWIALPAGFLVVHLTDILGFVKLRPALGDSTQSGSTNRYLRCLGSALDHAAYVGQIRLNYKSKTFAGESRVTLFLQSVYKVLIDMLLKHVYAISGHIENRPELTLADLVWPALVVMQAYQALVFPSVDQDAQDEDEE
ncbi:hypothetical protein OC846_001738 [Tilletia horrida]|uniref:Uncharacterized protein n=1 Tax=Tilletia horrida TaxID=155126 RepID=A0AAN6GVE5_9BASI|nr:hypothetical protein OC846_001738 [Tilletia horrida]KAK0563969.1 hypothetical protein OC861_004551 [Tilletia horrida]